MSSTPARNAILSVTTVSSLIAAGIIGWRSSDGVERVNGSIATFADHWRAVAAANPRDPHALHLVALGDSSVQGVGATSPETGWLPQFAARLAEHTGRPVEIWNLSVSGSTTEGVLREQLTQLEDLPVTPDLCVLGIGGNDAGNVLRSVAEYTTAMDVILDMLPSGSLVADPPWLFRTPVIGPRSTRMAEAVAPMIAGRGHVLVPLHAATRTAGWGYLAKTAEDLFHPNDDAYALWTEVFWEALEESGRLEELLAAAPRHEPAEG